MKCLLLSLCFKTVPECTITISLAVSLYNIYIQLLELLITFMVLALELQDNIVQLQLIANGCELTLIFVGLFGYRSGMLGTETPVVPML